MSKLVPGLHGRKELVVTPAMLASSVGSGLVDVFSTAMMVAWMEATAVEVVQGLLEDGQTTVGTASRLHIWQPRPAAWQYALRPSSRTFRPTAKA